MKTNDLKKEKRMKTNDLKKGTRIKLANGWEATMADNLKGSRRMAEVYGFVTETGSIYAHDIVAYKTNEGWKTDIEYSKSQLETKKVAEAMEF